MVMLSGFLSISMLTTGHDWGGDFAQYIMQAQSIVEGDIDGFMRQNRFAMEESSYSVGPAAYPWGLPLLLAPVYYFTGNNMIAFKMVLIVCYLLFLFLLWFGFRTDHNQPGRFILLIIFAVNPFMLGFMNSIFADIPFLLFSTAGILLMRRLYVEQKQLFHYVTDGVLLGVLIAWSIFFRNNGLLLLFTLVIVRLTGGYLTYKRARSSCNKNIFALIPWLLPFLSCGVFLIIWHVLFPAGGTSHIHHLQELSIAQITGNIHYYFFLPAEFLSTGNKSVDIAIYMLSLPFAFLGIFRRFHRDYPILIYCALTLVLYILWPYRQGLRFIFPVLPFYISFVLTGASVFPDLLSSFKIRRAVHSFYIVFLVMIIGSMSIQSIGAGRKNLQDQRQPPPGPYSPDAQEMFSYIRMMVRNSEEDKVVIFFKPRVMRLMTGGASILINEPGQLDRGDYLCVHPAPDKDQIPREHLVLMKESGNLQLMYYNNTFSLYKLLKP